MRVGVKTTYLNGKNEYHITWARDILLYIAILDLVSTNSLKRLKREGFKKVVLSLKNEFEWKEKELSTDLLSAWKKEFCPNKVP